MNQLTYRVGMEGGDINATFEFSADAESFAKAKSRKVPEIRYVVRMFASDGRELTSCVKFFQAGRKAVARN